jgi:hypothetical protein
MWANACSEAGPRRQSQGNSGGPEVAPSAPARGGADGIHRWKSLRVWKATAVGAPCVERALGASGCSGASQGGSGRDRKRQWLGHSTYSVGQKLAGRFPLRPRQMGWPPTGMNGWKATAGERGTNHAVTRGRRRRPRLSGAFVEVVVLNSAQACWGTGGGGSGSRKGASRALESWWIQRVLVTTSRLQILARGIFPSTG